jgi:hypothetical protein
VAAREDAWTAWTSGIIVVSTPVLKGLIANDTL